MKKINDYRQDYINLSYKIKWSDDAGVIKVLSSNSNLDILRRGGEFFIMAIEENSYDIVRSLLKYFEENQLSKCESRLERVHLKDLLLEALEVAVEDVSLSAKMKEVLSKWSL